MPLGPVRIHLVLAAQMANLVAFKGLELGDIAAIASAAACLLYSFEKDTALPKAVVVPVETKYRVRYTRWKLQGVTVGARTALEYSSIQDV